jgi:hypothetical protein
MPEGCNKSPTLFDAGGSVTQDYVWLQILEKYNIDPIDFFGLRKSEWQTEKGKRLKTLMFAKRCLDAEEEKRQQDEMDKELDKNKDPRKKGR